MKERWRRGRRKWSWLLALLLVVSFVPVTAYAADEPVEYSLDGGNTWTSIDCLENAVFACYSTDGAIIRLKDNIVLDSSYYGVVPAFGSNTMILDGNGYTISRGEYKGPFFDVNQEGSKFVLRNITLDGGAVWSGTDPATRTNSGTVLGGTGYFMYVGDGATLTLESGAVLQNNHVEHSAYNAAIHMEGGGTLLMKQGAVIRNNAAVANGDYGGVGSAVAMSASDTFYMEGGLITGNYASVAGGGVLSNGIFEMTGGKISGNVSGNNGGGVLVQAGTFRVSGTPSISGNTSKGSTQNVYLNSGTLVNVAGALRSGATIGMANPTEGAAFTSGWNAHMGAADPGAYFTVDTEPYAAVLNRDGEAMFHAHSFGTYVDDDNATCTEDGTETATCSCGETDTRIIPGSAKDHTFVDGECSECGERDPNAGAIQNTTNPDTNAYGGNLLIDNAEELKEKIPLEKEEQDRVDAGESVNVFLVVKDISDSKEPEFAEDKRKVEQEAKKGKNTIGMFLDLTLFKQIGNDVSTRKPIANTRGEVTIHVKLPDSLINKDKSVTRTYHIMRVHNGVVSLLDCRFDAKAGAIGFETDAFSTYALVYQDVKNDSGNDDGETTTPGGNDDGGTTTPGGNDDDGTTTPGGDDGGTTTPGGNDDGGATTPGGNDDGGATTPGGNDGGGTTTPGGNDNAPGKKDHAPKTGETFRREIYVTLAMIAGFTGLFCFLKARRRGWQKQRSGRK